jgi:hypothetical protein
MTNVFDYVKNINKKDDQLELTSEYVPYIINKAFSTYYDTIFYSNAINIAGSIDHQWQYDFYYHGVPKNVKRFAKYPKKVSDKYLLVIQEYYNCSLQKAKEIVQILDENTLQIIEMKLNKGGKDG